MMGGYYAKALSRVCQVTTIGPAFEGAQSDIPCEPEDSIAKKIEGLHLDALIVFYSKPDFFPADLHRIPLPKAWYLYDTHVHFEELSTVAHLFDHLWVHDRNTQAMMLKAGLRSVGTLPFAADVSLYHRPYQAQKTFKYEAGFAGSITDHPQLLDRKRFLEHLCTKVDVRIENRTKTGAAVADFFQECRVVLNHAIKNDLNMRIPEALMSGRALLTPAVPGLEDVLEPGKHCETYRSHEEALVKLQAMIAEPEKTEAMALAGQAWALKHHSYDVRAEQMLSDSQAWLRQSQQATSAFSPWLKAAAQFRYHWFRAPGYALEWLNKELQNEKGFVFSCLRCALKLAVQSLKLAGKLKKTNYFLER